MKKSFWTKTVDELTNAERIGLVTICTAAIAGAWIGLFWLVDAWDEIRDFFARLRYTVKGVFHTWRRDREIEEDELD